MDVPVNEEIIDELAEFLSNCDDVRRSAVKEYPADTKKKLRSLTQHQQMAVDKLLRMNKKYPNGITLRDFAQMIQASPSAASVMVDGLMGRGLLVREQNPEDRRTVCIRLTECGVKSASAGKDLLSKHMGERLSRLTAEETQQLVTLLRKLNA